jgi:glycolate oxidase FAD binding subunit
MMQAVRSVFDPKGLCNPGKILPAEIPGAKTPQRVEPPALLPDIAAAAIGLVGRAHSVTGTQAEAFALDGQRPQAAIFPASQGQVAQVLEWADSRGIAVVPFGGGTSSGMGNPLRRYDLALCLGRMNHVLDYRPADMVITVQAGITIAALQEALARSGQFDPHNPPIPPLPGRATVGGVIAADAGSPLRCAYGPVRNHLLQVTAVLPGGVVIKSGAPVAKNVAGYNLCRLLTGSLGTLAVITSATLRVAPLPRSTAAVAAAFSGASRAAEAAAQISASEICPAFVELLSPAMARPEIVRHIAGRHCVVAGAQGNESAAAWQRERLLDMFREAGADSVEVLPDAQAGLRALSDLHHPEGISCRATLPPAALANFCWHAESTADSLGIELAYICHSANGIADIRLGGGASQEDAIISALERLREAARNADGHLVLTAAPAEVKARFSTWGEPDKSLRIAQGLKQAFDPNGTLSPGRFLGGI